MYDVTFFQVHRRTSFKSGAWSNTIVKCHVLSLLKTKHSVFSVEWHSYIYWYDLSIQILLMWSKHTKNTFQRFQIQVRTSESEKTTHLATGLIILSHNNFWRCSCTFLFRQETRAKAWVRPREKREKSTRRRQKWENETDRISTTHT